MIPAFDFHIQPAAVPLDPQVGRETLDPYFRHQRRRVARSRARHCLAATSEPHASQARLLAVFAGSPIRFRNRSINSGGVNVTAHASAHSDAVGW